MSKKFVLLLLNILLICSAVDSWKKRSKRGPMTSVDIDDIGYAPFMVRVHNWIDKKYMSCSGILITKICVLTAAHCTVPIANKNVSVLTMRNPTVIRRSRTVDSIYVPKFYNKDTYDGDVAIIRVKVVIQPDEAVWKDVEYRERYPDEDILTIGWATKFGDNGGKRRLHKITSKARSIRYCNDKYESILFNMFCTEPLVSINEMDAGSVAMSTFDNKAIGLLAWSARNDVLEGRIFAFTRFGEPKIANFIRSTKEKYCKWGSG